MYKLNPIVQQNLPIDLPTTMYTMKPIYGEATPINVNDGKTNATAANGVSRFASQLRSTNDKCISHQIQKILQVFPIICFSYLFFHYLSHPLTADIR